MSDGNVPSGGQATTPGRPWTPSGAGESVPVPAGMRLTPDAATRLVPGGPGLAGGQVLTGGSPVRVLRLTPAGARQVSAWFAGTPVPDGAGARALARRLLDAGIAHPDVTRNPDVAVRPDPTGPVGDAALTAAVAGIARAPAPDEVTVVIPVRDRHAELDRCLAGLADLAHVIVVDDASADPRAIKRIAAAHGADVVHRPVNGGPGAARNTGLAAAVTPYVAFLDSDCAPRPGWLAGLLPHFADPALGAVAPRIVPHEHGGGWLARYEGASSTLDMGARPSPVRPGARVSYVPGAALVVRRAAAGTGFRERMHVGEDVDFVWRMTAAGWRARYEPGAVMRHDHRVAFRAWFARRADYGSSAAALEQLHPGAVRPLYVSWWTAGAWAAALSGRPVAAAALTAAATALLARRLSRVTGERWPLPLRSAAAAGATTATGIAGTMAAVSATTVAATEDNSKKRCTGPARRAAHSREFLRQGRGPGGAAAWMLAARLAAGGTVASGIPLGNALSRAWWPLAIPAAVAVPRLRLPVAALLIVPPLLDWANRKPPLDPARYVAARLLDDVAYSLGVWQGCLARRTARPLLPVLGRRRPR